MTRHATSIHVIFTNVGEFVCPGDLDAALAAAPKRKDGQVDRRFVAGRRALQDLEAFIALKEAEDPGA